MPEYTPVCGCLDVPTLPYPYKDAYCSHCGHHTRADKTYAVAGTGCHASGTLCEACWNRLAVFRSK